jgi:hypothetical protein
MLLTPGEHTAADFELSDTQGNTYPNGGEPLDVYYDDSGPCTIAQSYVLGASSGPTTVNLTYPPGGNPQICLWVREVGPTSTTAIDNHTTADTASSTTPTLAFTINNAGGALISCLCSDANQNQQPTTGSGWTAGITGWTGIGAVSQSLFVPSAGSENIVFGLPSADVAQIFAIGFLPASGSGSGIPIAWLRV